MTSNVAWFVESVLTRRRGVHGDTRSSHKNEFSAPSLRRLRASALKVTLLLLLATPAFPSGSIAWEMTSFSDFVRGHFDGISLSRDGRLTLGPKLDTVFTSDQPVIWSVAEAPDGTLYAATGNRGRIYKIDRAGKSALYWTASEPEVFAIAAGRDGAIYAGTSPSGKVYRIENGAATEYFAP